jgi:hypothetical protein
VAGDGSLELTADVAAGESEMTALSVSAAQPGADRLDAWPLASDRGST